MVEEIIGRLPDLTESQLGRLEDELRRERQRRAFSEGGGEGAPQIHEDTTPPLTEVLEYRPHETRTATYSWSYAATSVATAPPASADPTGTSSTTRAASARSSTSARPATRRVLWPPSGLSPRRSRSLRYTGPAHGTRNVSS
jgi:hypothetical protein